METKIDVANRIARLRTQMAENKLDAYILNGTDPHLSEYTPEGWKTREWISGFTGSYGKVLVTRYNAFLWTDTRYFLQATEELAGTGIELMKERVPDAISIEDWMSANLKPGSRVGVDGLTISAAEKEKLESILGANGILLDPEVDLVSKIWENRPFGSASQAYEHPVCYAGISRSEKIHILRSHLESEGLDATIITTLDDVAWLFNLRSNEIEYTPLVTSYGYVSIDEAFIFIAPEKVPNELRESLEKEKVQVQPYDAFFPFLKRIASKKIQFDPLRSNSSILKHIAEDNTIHSSVSITTRIKAVKSAKEIEGIRSAHVKDGVAMVHSLFWINQVVGSEIITEISVGNKLNEFRGREPLFKGDSFHPIVGFGPHGAIVHYHATQRSDSVIHPDNLLLIDSGGQYLNGTTDITRTIVIGSPSEKQKRDFTICLKGHINLATAIFPQGTKGYSLDPIARKPLWDNGINYGHGTGHGIGYFLSVHEGPMSIRTEFNNELILEGHLLSNEPGIYRTGEYGVRIENVILCKKHSSTEFGDFLCFETLSLCPIERKLIDTKLLSKDEIQWLNNYHETVLTTISPLIEDPEVLSWLKEQCASFE